MNSLAVALAADSAATVSNGRDNKVYNSANKLFMLSKHHPVGVMVYNNSSLLGIPWETLLKMFRQKLGTQEFDRLEEYGEALIKFLDQNAYLFPEDSQHRSYLALVETLYEGIHAAILEKIEEQVVRLPVDSAITEAEVSEMRFMRNTDCSQNVFAPLFFKDLFSAVWAPLRLRPKDEVDDGVTYGGHGWLRRRPVDSFFSAPRMRGDDAAGRRRQSLSSGRGDGGPAMIALRSDQVQAPPSTADAPAHKSIVP